MRLSHFSSSASIRRRSSECDCWADGSIMARSGERDGQAISLVLGLSDVNMVERVEVLKVRLLSARKMIKLRVTLFPCADHSVRVLTIACIHLQSQYPAA